MVAPFSKFYGKIWVSFCLNTGKRFFIEVSFSSQQKEQRKVLLKNDTRDFQISSLWDISENFEHFQYFNFETDFLENENFFQKTGVPFFS